MIAGCTSKPTSKLFTLLHMIITCSFFYFHWLKQKRRFASIILCSIWKYQTGSHLSPNRITYTWTAYIPHCTSAMPNQTESAGIHSQKMLFAENLVPFYLIISDCYASRHNPLFHTFMGNNCIHCGYIFTRNGILPPLYLSIDIDG